MDRRALLPGLSATVPHVVEEDDTAVAVGSGSLPVLATPRLATWWEAAACAAIEASLEDGTTSVGTRLSLEHLLPSPVGSHVSCAVTLVRVDGRLLRFEVVATTESGRLVAHGEITRVVVDVSRFLDRAARR